MTQLLDGIKFTLCATFILGFLDYYTLTLFPDDAIIAVSMTAHLLISFCESQRGLAMAANEPDELWAIQRVCDLIREGWLTREDFEADFRYAEEELRKDEEVAEQTRKEGLS